MSWSRLSLRPVDRRACPPATETKLYVPLRSACLALVCGMLVSCGGAEPRLAPPAEPYPETNAKLSAVAEATPAAATLGSPIGAVVWAAAIDPATNEPIEPVSSYTPDSPRIIASIHASGLRAGSVVEATWEYNDTSLDAFTTRLAPTDSPAERWLSFHIARDPQVLWPVGTYEVTISVDGARVQQAAVNVSERS